MQRELTDKILFEYYMASSASENEIYTPFPYYLERELYNQMVQSTIVLDRLVRRLIERMASGSHDFPFQSDEFPLKSEILNMSLPLPQFFWARYDAFQRPDGGIFFSEFNYDKPCAQREIAVSELIKPYQCPNDDFTANFRMGFQQQWERFNGKKRVPTVAILVDPGHYEELHLAYLYSDILKPLNYNILIVGGRNITVENGMAVAFGKEIDIILRQFPTEFLYELPVFGDILKLYESGRVLLLNDPRSITGQAKSIFATLWEMAERNDSFLSKTEIDVIKKTLPYTALFSPKRMDELLENKDKYVVKAAFGRFSEEVYIGNMHTDSEWEETLEYVLESGKLHIIQEFCPIKREKILKFTGSRYEEQDAFGNFGIYLVNGSPSGVSLRWSNDYLSLDEAVWIGAVGVRDRSIYFSTPVQKDYERIWNEINDKMAFEHGFTGGFTGSQQSFSLQPLFLDSGTFTELKSATLQVTSIVEKTTRFVCDNAELLCPVLGISSNLAGLIAASNTELPVFIGRYDWVMDAKGSLKLLEFNSETPAGLMESIFLNEAVKSRLGIHAENPNTQMKQLIRDCFERIISVYEKHGEIRNIGIVSSTYGEDWYNTTIIYDLVKDLPYHFCLGEVSGLKAENGKLHLYGTPLDALYRYYPLDWFESDEYYAGVTECLEKGTPSINPPLSLISQSKAFFALVYELKAKGFYNDEENAVIEKYIPRTALRPDRAFKGIYCLKPCFGREGGNIAFSFKEPFPPERDDYVFQQWVDIQNTPLEIHSAGTAANEPACTVIGTYLVGESFGGVYVRAGGRITDKWAINIPVYIRT